MTVPGRHPIGGAVPHRVRAAYELHLRELSPPTQLALKGLAVHPGRLPDALVHAFANGTALYELELHNWLVYEDVWRVSRATAQRVLYQSLMPGQRLQFRQQAAKALAAGGHRLAATYHRLRLGKTVDVADLLEHVSGWRRPVLAGALGAVPTLEPLPTASVYVGSPLALGCEGTRGPGVQVDGSFGRWWRTADVSEAGRAVWSLPPESLVMRISGRALVHNPLGIGLHGDAAPLRIRVLGTDLTIVLCDVPEPGLADDDIVLPIDVDFEYTLALPPATGLEIESKARTGVVELELTLCRHEGGRLGSRNDTGPAESAFDLRSGRLLRRALRRMRGNYQARQDG